MRLRPRAALSSLAGCFLLGGVEALRGASAAGFERSRFLAGGSAAGDEGQRAAALGSWTAFLRPDASESAWRFNLAAQDYRNTGICARWTDPDTGAVRVNKRPSEMLSALSVHPTIDEPDALADRWWQAIQFRDYRELVALTWETVNSPFVIASAIIGFSVLALYFLGFAWKTCCRGCRRSCCFIQEKRRTFSAGRVTALVMIGGVLLGAALVLLGLGESRSIEALSAAGSAGCVLQQTVVALRSGTKVFERGNGSSSKKKRHSENNALPTDEDKDGNSAFADEDVPMENFIGLNGLQKNVNSLSNLTSPYSDGNVKQLFEGYLLTSLDRGQRAVDHIEDTASIFTRNLETAKTLAQNYNHIVLPAETLTEVEEVVGTVVTEADEEFTDFSDHLQTGLNNIELPNIDPSQLFPVAEVEAAVADAESMAASVTQEATPVAKWLGVAVGMEGLLLVAGLLAAAVALVLFLMSVAKQSSTLMGASWHFIAIFAGLSLLTTSAFFLFAKVGNHVCAWTAQKTLFKTQTDGGEAGNDSHFISGFGELVLGSDVRQLEQCLTHPNVNLIDALNKRADFERALDKIDTCKHEALLKLPQYSGSHNVSHHVARLREVANEYGDLVIFNVEAYRQKHNLQENFTFEAVMKSGLQWEDRKFDSESKVLFGLKSVEKALAPARLGLKGHSFGEDVFVISAKNPPSRDDETFKAWLEARKKEYEGRDGHNSEDAKKYGEMLKEGVMVAQLKIKLLEASTGCISARGTRICSGKELLGEGMNAIKATAEGLAEAGDRLDGLLVELVDQARTTADGLFETVRSLSVEAAEGANCGFVRRYLTEAAFLACPLGVQGVNSAAFFRFVGALVAVLLFAYLMILWRFIKDNQVLGAEDGGESLPGDVPSTRRGTSHDSHDSHDDSQEAQEAAASQESERELRQRSQASEAPSEKDFDEEQPLVTAASIRERDEVAASRQSMWASNSGTAVSDAEEQ